MEACASRARRTRAARGRAARQAPDHAALELSRLLRSEQEEGRKNSNRVAACLVRSEQEEGRKKSNRVAACLVKRKERVRSERIRV